jgi:phosphotransferase system enzyme I (PtsI)
MQKLMGKTVFEGIAIGKIKLFRKKEAKVIRKHIDDSDEEIKRFDKAKKSAIEQLQKLYDRAVKEVGEANAAIFEVHQMMLQDIDYAEAVIHIIRTEKVNVEYAVACTSDNFSEMFSSMEDDYMRERAADVRDVSNRLISVLQGRNMGSIGSNEPVIIVADDLAPSETVQLDKNNILAFVTRGGSTNSHTAILARTMNIPALIGVDYSEKCDGKLAIVDGYKGEIYISPDEEIIDKYRRKMEEEQNKKRLLQELKGKANITKDGREILIYANISSTSDVINVLQNDAGGIGLFRSEFLYLEKDNYPTEEEQFNVYKTVARNMAGKRVIIRTLDIGADKQVEYFGMDKEENPAMGYRAIRICLDRKDIFKTQLRAIYRASAFGNISIMFPMIISVSEVKKIKEIVEEVKCELDKLGVAYSKVELGIMIETPAAVMISDLLAKEVDFFSIGTNDLTQYTLAIDRQNPKLDNIYDSHHEAILRMIKMVVENGHKEGCMVGICGELAADITLTEEFLRMGVDELSVSPSFVLKLRETVRNIDLSK